MPLNHYVTLGHSGLRVSPLCLGAMTFGEDWGWGSTIIGARTMQQLDDNLGAIDVKLSPRTSRSSRR
jgi:aryl-alcohol dehydrogenase-like predicted oxidoreductase